MDRVTPSRRAAWPWWEPSWVAHAAARSCSLPCLRPQGPVVTPWRQRLRTSTSLAQPPGKARLFLCSVPVLEPLDPKQEDPVRLVPPGPGDTPGLKLREGTSLEGLCLVSGGPMARQGGVQAGWQDQHQEAPGKSLDRSVTGPGDVCHGNTSHVTVTSWRSLVVRAMPVSRATDALLCAAGCGGPAACSYDTSSLPSEHLCLALLPINPSLILPR